MYFHFQCLQTTSLNFFFFHNFCRHIWLCLPTWANIFCKLKKLVFTVYMQSTMFGQIERHVLTRCHSKCRFLYNRFIIVRCFALARKYKRVYQQRRVIIIRTSKRRWLATVMCADAQTSLMESTNSRLFTDYTPSCRTATFAAFNKFVILISDLRLHSS